MSALNSTAEQVLFPSIAETIPWVDHFYARYSVCELCFTNHAWFTCRRDAYGKELQSESKSGDKKENNTEGNHTDEKNPLVRVGGKETYFVCCTTCLRELYIIKKTSELAIK